MSKKSHHFLTLWPWPLTYDLEKLIRSGHYHYQCVYQIWEQSIPWFLSYRVNTIAGGGRLGRKTITSPDPSDTGDIKKRFQYIVQLPIVLLIIITMGVKQELENKKTFSENLIMSWRTNTFHTLQTLCDAESFSKSWRHYLPFVKRIHWWPVESPHKRPVSPSFDISFVVRLKKLLKKQSSCWWFQRSWHHCNSMVWSLITWSFFFKILGADL